MTGQWQERQRPARLEGRYEFASYRQLRDFLDQAAELSETEGLYPDLGFGRDYVNVTISAEDGAEELAASQRDFAQRLDRLSDAVVAA